MFNSNSKGNERFEVSDVAEFLLLKILENVLTGLEECFFASLSLVAV